MARVILAMSGGVDSSVAADLLLRDGHEVIGVFMRHGEKSPVACALPSAHSSGGETAAALPILERPDHKQGCCTASDAEDGRRVADRLGIPFYSLDLNTEFQRIIDYFVDQYSAGRTPNPCVQCNNWLKFGKLFDYADSVGAEFVATGHYARLQSLPSKETALLRGVDRDKDQSYVLFGIERSRLPRMLLPVGGFQKSEIRARAQALGLAVAQKRDSQEICFVAQGKHGEFIRARRPAGANRSGEIVTTEGRVVGRHEGIESFTIGQRKGLAVAMGEPYYVVRIEPDTRRVVIGRHDALARRIVWAQGANWLVDVPQAPRRCEAMIRYNSAAESAWLHPDPAGGAAFRVEFDRPRFGVAPGQAIVCYDGERVLGGGWIERAQNDPA